MAKEKSSSRSSKNSAADRMPAQQQLDSFLAKYTSEIAVFARRALVKMRRVVPGAVEIVYDNYNALAIGFGPSERASEAIFSVVLYPKNVTLFFLQGAKLPDLDNRLRGSGNVVRHIRLNEAGKPDAKVLDDPEVQRLMEEALRRAKMPMPSGARRRLVIKSVSAKQRPRQPKS
jgi:hypothetical protein